MDFVMYGFAAISFPITVLFIAGLIGDTNIYTEATAKKSRKVN